MSRSYISLLKAVSLGIVIMLLGATCWMFLSGGSKRADWSSPAMLRGRSLAIIGAALNGFRGDHEGRLPSRLSELVPRYIAVTNASCFFAWRERAEELAVRGTDLLVNAIDHDSAFVYLGDTGQSQDLVLYERTPSTEAKHIMTLANDLAGVPRSRNDLDARLHRLGERAQ